MEPQEKRLKIDNETLVNADSNNNLPVQKESLLDGRNSPENQSSQQAETERVEIDAGNEQFPVCEHGVDCSETDLIHFAEFWHPTKPEDKEENNLDEDECLEENECEVVDLPCYEIEATQEVLEEYSDSESDDVDGNSITQKKSQDNAPQ